MTSLVNLVLNVAIYKKKKKHLLIITFKITHTKNERKRGLKKTITFVYILTKTKEESIIIFDFV